VINSFQSGDSQMSAIVTPLKVVVTIGGTATNFYFLGKTADYADAPVQTATGIVAAAGAELAQPTIKLANLLRKGYLLRVVISYLTAGNVYKTARLVASRDKIATVIAALEATTYKALTIKSARFPVPRHFI
jgi:hypothetical protein